MALFTDGPPCSIDDLGALDSQLADVANVEGIDVTKKLKLAHEELAVEIESRLCFRVEQRPDLSAVVVTPPLKLWHAYRTLEMVYADAYNSQLNDRYAGRRDQFRARAGWSHEKLLQTGLGMVTIPMAKAAAPQASTVPGGPMPTGTYYLTMAWVNRSGEEGAAAAAVDVTTNGNTIAVQPGAKPANATGWNVFLGSDPAEMVQQNESPLAAEETWVQFVPPAVSGRKPGQGQAPNYLKPLPRMLQRG